MIAITKDKAFNLKYDEVSKKINGKGKTNKIVVILLELLAIFSITNIVLIYKFFSILLGC